MSDGRPLISERNARDLSPGMRAKYHVISPRPLTREEVARAYAFARQEARPASLLVYLLADLDRLRALVKEVERNIESECSWCGADRSRTERNNDASAYEPHAAHCPAFTPDGVVK